MSPHALILLAALLSAATAKLVFPTSTVRIVLGVTIGLPLVVIVFLGEAPSLLGLAIVLPLALIGAVLGVGVGGWVARSWRQIRAPR